MTKAVSESKHTPRLRRQAEKAFSERTKKPEPVDSRDIDAVIHELKAYQVELETQNEALRQTYIELARSQSEYANFYDFSPVGFLTLDRKGLILELNLTAAGLLDYDRQLLKGKPFHFFVSSPSKKVFYRCKKTVLRSPKSETCELVLQKRDGTLFHGHLECMAVKRGDRTLIRSVLIDVTERTQAEEEAKKLTAAVEEERDRLSTLLNSIQDEVWFTDEKGKFTRANLSALQEFGFDASVKEIDVGKLIRSMEVYRPDGSPRPFDETPPLRALRGEVVKNEEEVIRTPRTGELRYREISAVPVRDAGGAITGSVSVVRDITDRKRMEEELRRARDELEARVQQRTAELQSARDKIVEQSRIMETSFTSTVTPLVLLDKDFNFIKVNEAYARACQKEISYFVGHNHFEFYPHEENEAIFRRVVETKAPYRAVAKPFTFPDHPEWGTTYWDWTLSPTFDKAGEVEFLLFSLEDVTEQKRAEERIRQAHKMEAIGTLAGGIAHDFNNLLEAIIGFSELARDLTPDDSKAQHYLKRVFDASVRGRDLVRQILAFSRRSEGEHTEIRLTSVVKETYELLRPSLPTTIHMPLAITTNDDYVFADSTQLQQVLMNLVTNAAHAMRGAVGQLTIGLSSATFSQDSLPDPDLKPGTYVQLTVQDTGIGMTEETRQRIFEPFFTTKEPGQGSGMGLAVVHGIVKSHGGTVTVRSEVGQGSIFEVFLPQMKKPKTHKEEVISSSLPTGTERVLFIDDEEILAEMAQTTLERLGYHVTVATHGLDGWNLFRENPYQFDLVITDQTMPGITGVTLAQKVLGMRKEMPIILCTGYSEMVSAEKAKEVGICEFVMKPLSRKELAEVVRKVLDEKNSA